MNKLATVAMLAAFSLLAAADEPPRTDCPPPPPKPPQDQAWAVQIDDVTWRTDVPGWVPVPFPICWKLGRVPLEYTGADNGTDEVTDEEGPWIEGSDYPVGEPCPERAHGNCAPLPKPKE
jgi:hypothetical protein